MLQKRRLLKITYATAGDSKPEHVLQLLMSPNFVVVHLAKKLMTNSLLYKLLLPNFEWTKNNNAFNSPMLQLPLKLQPYGGLQMSI